MHKNDSSCSMFDIAVIGMDGRFPKAKNIFEFWNNIKNGVECITFYTEDELLKAGIKQTTLNDKNYIKAKGTLEKIDMFDADFFGINRREAEVMDPQQRVMLEVAWGALENAGYDSERYDGKIGFFAGEAMNSYMLSNLYSNAEEIFSTGILQAAIGNDKDSLTTNVSYRMNLKGPAITVQTSSSTSLVAVCMASQSLINFQCDIALAGGVAIGSQEKSGYQYSEGGITSHDGHCRPFDDKSSGFVPGTGVGVVVLKRLSDAIKDGDTINAVIKGYAVNNDGSSKISYTAPSINGQSDVITEALMMAELNPESIGLVEAHGTGTYLGDPIEIAALTQAYRLSTKEKEYCAIGSVKANIGHLDTAAGIVGLIKTVLALRDKVIPPSINFETPNSQIDFKNSPFFINAVLRKWDTNRYPRRAGVTSLGMGGTNAHVVLEEYQACVHDRKSREWKTLLLSSRTPSALISTKKNLTNYLSDNKNINLSDVEFSLQIGRKEFDYRYAVVVRDIDDAIKQLNDCMLRKEHVSNVGMTNNPITFMFPGQGTQYVNMGRGLYESEPMFKEQVEICSKILRPYLNEDLCNILYPSEKNEKSSEFKLSQTCYTQPALFVVEYALAKLWISWGVIPTFLIGHSVGEYVAACVSGVLTLNDALRLIVKRSKLMQNAPHGRMISVYHPIDEVISMMSGELDLAAINSEYMCVCSGKSSEIDNFKIKLDELGIRNSVLTTSHGFHSRLMNSLLGEYKDVVESITFSEPQIPYISNVTGDWITFEDVKDSEYWIRHLRQTVLFKDGVEKLLYNVNNIYLEVGPGNTLCSLVRDNCTDVDVQTIISSIGHSQNVKSDSENISSSIRNLWLNGVSLDWEKYHMNFQRKRIPLPTYPFEHKRYWVEPKESRNASLLKRNENIDRLQFFTPTWLREVYASEKLPLCSKMKTDSYWLIITFENNLYKSTSSYFKDSSLNYINLVLTNKYSYESDNIIKINFDRIEHIQKLQEEFNRLNVEIMGIVIINRNNNTSNFSYSNIKAYRFLLSLIKHFTLKRNVKELSVIAVTEELFDVIGNESLNEESSILHGMIKYIDCEFQNVKTKIIDCDSNTFVNPCNKFDEILLTEIALDGNETMVSYRKGKKWICYDRELDLSNQRNMPISNNDGVHVFYGSSVVLKSTFIKTVLSTKANHIVIVDPAEKIIGVYNSKSDSSFTTIEYKWNYDETYDLQNLWNVLGKINSIYRRIDGLFMFDELYISNQVSRKMDLNLDNLESMREKVVLRFRTLEKIKNTYAIEFCVLNLPLDSYYQETKNFEDVIIEQFRISYFRKKIQDSDGWNIKYWVGEDIVSSNDYIRCKNESNFDQVWLSELAKVFINRCNVPELVIKQRKIKSDEGEIKSNSNNDSVINHKDNKDNFSMIPLDRNSIFEVISKLYTELLGLQRIDGNEQFFSMGGHSLLAIQLLSRVNSLFEIRITLNAFFENSSVEALTDLILKERSISSDEDKYDVFNELLLQIEEFSEDEIDNN